MSPTQRTLALLRGRGFVADVVERWIPGGFVRRDYLNIVDILAITGRDTIGVQSCGEAFSDHWKKMTEEHSGSAKAWLENYSRRLLLIGWRPVKVKRGGVAKRYEPRESEVFLFDLKGGEPMRTPAKKYEEMRRRGRTNDQIRAVAIARGDKELELFVAAKAKSVEDLC